MTTQEVLARILELGLPDPRSPEGDDCAVVLCLRMSVVGDALRMRGSVVGECGLCGEAVSMAPSSLKIVTDARTPHLVCCVDHMAAFQELSGPIEVQAHPEQMEELKDFLRRRDES